MIVINTRIAPIQLSYTGAIKNPKARVLPRAKGFTLKPGKNRISAKGAKEPKLGEIPFAVWEENAAKPAVQMLLKAGVLKVVNSEAEVPDEFDPGKATLQMDLAKAKQYVADLGSKSGEGLDILQDIFRNDERPEVREAVEKRLEELS